MEYDRAENFLFWTVPKTKEKLSQQSFRKETKINFSVCTGQLNGDIYDAISGYHGGQIEGTLQRYGTEELKEGPQSTPHCAERREPLMDSRLHFCQSG